MWQYHTLASALKEGTRAVITKGRGCSTNGNSCTMTVGSVAQAISSAALGISPLAWNVTMTTASGATQTCNPLKRCFTNSSTWPPSANNDDLPGKVITITGQLPFHMAMGMAVPGSKGVDFAAVTLTASSAQAMQF
jgi:hypothetical protein